MDIYGFLRGQGYRALLAGGLAAAIVGCAAGQGEDFQIVDPPELSMCDYNRTVLHWNDLDGDGDKDLLALKFRWDGGNDVYVALCYDSQYGTTCPNPNWVLRTQSNIRRIAVCDEDGDGRADILVEPDGSAGIVALGNGDGTFQEPRYTSSTVSGCRKRPRD